MHDAGGKEQKFARNQKSKFQLLDTADVKRETGFVYPCTLTPEPCPLSITRSGIMKPVLQYADTPALQNFSP
jgi:hypothetical protein